MDTLRAFIRKTLINEGPVDPVAAAKLGLALTSAKDGGLTTLILYNPKAFVSRLRDIVKEWEESGSQGGERFPINRMFDAEGAVLGMVMVRKPPGGPCHGAVEVVNSAAEKGFGPTLYDIAMSISPSHALISDRNSVSSSARGVWAKYQGRGDVKAMKLDDVENPKTPDKSDDCYVHDGGDQNPLNYAYQGAAKANVGAMMANHKEFVQVLQNLAQSSKFPMVKPESLNTTLLSAAKNYFQSRYKG